MDSIEHFDILVRPGDSKPIDRTNEQQYNIEKIDCNPIILADSSELYPKEHLRNRLGIPLDSTVVYIQLGAGENNNIESDLELSVRLCLEHESTFVVIGESMIGNPSNIAGERIRILRDYPNSLYFNSFDFAIRLEVIIHTMKQLLSNYQLFVFQIKIREWTTKLLKKLLGV